MTPFRDQPLARKALILGVVPSICAVTLLALASMTATFLRSRTNMQLDLEAQSAIVAESLSGALAFDDPASAKATLDPLHLRQQFEAVCVYATDGRMFAAYQQDRCGETVSSPYRKAWTSIVIEQPIRTASGQLGTIRLVGNMSRFYIWMRTQAVAVLSALLAGSLIAYFLTRRLSRMVSDPVLALARTADSVSARKDYSLRAAKATNDEVGGLVQSFNDMLDQIQRQNFLLNKEIADRKRAEELKDEFLAAVSHELRTPLNAILGRVQLLRQMKPTGDRLERAIDSLERNAESQARLVEDLLDVSRIVSGKFQMKFEVVDLRDVLSRAVEMIGPPAAAKSIHVNLALPHGPALVSGDGGRLEQATMNLLSNAVKFSVGGSIAVELSAIDSPREYAISVQDNGIGIAPEFLPMVFERFRQADGSLTREHGGLGLGLAIVKEVAELHGGSVVAASAGLGKGARFTIRIPQLIEADVRAPASTSTRRPPLLTPDVLKGVRVLVVEDEEESREIAAAALAMTGAAVTTAASGAEALERWAKGRFDVLVCDLAMPGMDGFQVVQRIREFDHRDGDETFAIALTAYASDHYRARSLAAGFNIHLAKPYHTDELVLAIADGFEQREAGSGTSG